MVADYRYYFGTIMSPGVIAEITLFGTYMDMELNVGGSFNGSYQLDQTGIDNEVLMGATVPGYSYVMVERNGVVIWGGYLWSRTYQSQAKSMQLFAQSFEMFPNNQLIDFNLIDEDGSPLIPPGDQLQVFVGLWEAMQLGDGRNIGVTMPTNLDSGILIGAPGTAATDFKFFGEIMAEIANASFGFDWYIQNSRVGGAYIRELILGYPTVGTDLTNTTIVLEYPGNIVNYYQVESMANAGTNIIVTGSGDGSSMIFGRATDPNKIALGWPNWDRVASHKDVASLDYAQALAEQELVARRAPKTTIKTTMKGDILPEFGAVRLG